MSSMFDYEDLDAAAQQKTQAALLRQQQQDRLRAANEEANKYNTLAAVAQMANNKPLAEATGLMSKNQQAQHKPINLGAQGFALPGSGDFIASPMYEDEQAARRAATKEAALTKAAALAEAQRLRAEVTLGEGERNRALRLSLAQLTEGGKNSRADARAAEKAEGKVLPASNVDKFTKNQGTAEAFLDLGATFQDSFSGTPLVADAQNFAGRFGVANFKDQANWWQNYQEQVNQIRHQLFGSALTATEKAAFDKAVIVPGMDPTEIRRRLNQQAAAAVKAHNKLKQNFGAAGYNVSGFADLVAPDAALPGQQPTAPAKPAPGQAAPVTIPGLPPGFKVIGEHKP